MSTRTHETEIEIAATPAEIWKMIAEANGIVRWLAPEAKVESPGAGGSIWVSWGPGFDGASRIEIWEPERHLRLVAQDSKGRSEPLPVTDYYIEGRGGTTVLRIVQTFGPGADWESDYEGTRRGWPIFLWVMKHAIERHPEAGCVQVIHMHASQYSLDETWQRLAAALPGEVVSQEAPHEFRRMLRDYNDSPFYVMTGETGGSSYVFAGLYVFGASPGRVEEARRQLIEACEKALGPSSQVAAPATS